jgi:transcriptional regulator with XRE-family HTH domain
MKVAAVGSVIRAYRKASGISQKDLAGMVGISRATLNYLESGRDIEIGAGKLLALLDFLDVPLGLPEGVNRAHDDDVLEQAVRSAGGTGRNRLTRKTVFEALATGRVPDGSQPALTEFLDKTPEAAILAVVRAVSAGSGQSPKDVWKNGRGLAQAVGSDRRVWLRGSR